MADSRENLERKFSSDNILSYTSTEPRIMDVEKMLGKELARQLNDSCMADDVEAVKEILETNNIDVNARVWYGETPLDIACAHNKSSVIAFLLKQLGVEVDVENVFGKEIEEQLRTSCVNGDIEAVKEILKANNLGFNARLQYNYTPLVVAAKHNQSRLVEFLLAQGVNVLMHGYSDATALNVTLGTQAMRTQEKRPCFVNYRMAYNLVKAGADINYLVNAHMVGTFSRSAFISIFERPYTALLAAWHKGKEDRARDLINLGASISHSERLFNSDGQYRFVVSGGDYIHEQIEASKTYLKESVNNMKWEGIAVGCLYSRLGEEEFGCKVAEFLSEDYDCNVLFDIGFRTGLALMRNRVSKKSEETEENRLVRLVIAQSLLEGDTSTSSESQAAGNSGNLLAFSANSCASSSSIATSSPVVSVENGDAVRTIGDYTNIKVGGCC
jgi:hypothetical protein